MRLREIRRLFEYDAWANRRLYEALGQLSAEEFTREVAGSYGSVRNTMVHVASATWGWMERCGGPARGPRLEAKDYPTLESLMRVNALVESGMRDFLAILTDEGLEREVTYSFGAETSGTASVGHLLHHAATHAVHHRGQVALLVRALGHSPRNFDVLFFAGSR